MHKSDYLTNEVNTSSLLYRIVASYPELALFFNPIDRFVIVDFKAKDGNYLALLK